jgi:hypothetical protein
MTVDWSQAPKRARWWAMDRNGEAHWFCVPDVAPFTDFWSCESSPAPTFGYSGDWKQSLRERPATTKAGALSRLSGVKRRFSVPFPW